MCCTDEAAVSMAAPSSISCGVSSDVRTKTLPGVKLKMPIQEVVNNPTKTSQIRESIDLRQNSMVGRSPIDEGSTFVDLSGQPRRPSLVPLKHQELIRMSKDKTVGGNFC